MMLEIQVTACDRHKNVAGLNCLMGSQLYIDLIIIDHISIIEWMFQPVVCHLIVDFIYPSKVNHCPWGHAYFLWSCAINFF